MKHAAILPTFASLFVLAACATPAPPNNNCPNVAVLEQGSSITEFLPGRQDVAAQITQARITGVAGTCTLEKKAHVLRVTFQAGFSAVSGPANSSPTIVLPYLVSVSEGDSIIGKTNYTIPLTFDGNASTAAAVSKPITIKFPNNADTGATDILVSFQLTQDQLDYNAAHPGQ